MVSSIRLAVQVQPTETIPPQVWEMFQAAVKQAALNCGLRVGVGCDDGSLEQAKQRYWDAMRVTGATDAGRAQDSTG